MPRIDMHVHSSASFDSHTPPATVARISRRLGLSPVILTDHDSTDGAAALVALGVPTVVGQEITTTEGELIGLFLSQPLPKQLTPDEAVRRIHGQGGLVYLEHPYDTTRRSLAETAIERLADSIDIVEVYNGRSDHRANQRAADLRATLGVPGGAGSDAHRHQDIGSVYVELDAFRGPAQFLERLRTARVVVKPNRLLMRAQALVGR